jgi:hypothetical protein
MSYCECEDNRTCIVIFFFLVREIFFYFGFLIYLSFILVI